MVIARPMPEAAPVTMPVGEDDGMVIEGEGSSNNLDTEIYPGNQLARMKVCEQASRPSLEKWHWLRSSIKRNEYQGGR